MATDKPIWEIQVGETDNAFAAFQFYLRQGDGRAIRTAEAQYSKSHKGKKQAIKPSGSFTAWSRKYRWTERARAYDDHMARQTHAAVIKGTADRLAQFNDASFGIALLAFNKVKKAIDNYKGDVPPAVWAPLLSVADKIARLALGASTDNMATNLRVSMETLKGKELVEAIADPTQYAALMKIAEGMAERHAPRAN